MGRRPLPAPPSPPLGPPRRRCLFCLEQVSDSAIPRVDSNPLWPRTENIPNACLPLTTHQVIETFFLSGIPAVSTSEAFSPSLLPSASAGRGPFVFELRALFFLFFCPIPALPRVCVWCTSVPGSPERRPGWGVGALKRTNTSWAQRGGQGGVGEKRERGGEGAVFDL